MTAIELHDVAKGLRTTGFIKTQNLVLQPTAEESPSVQSPYEYFHRYRDRNNGCT
jgi:hypothetical protein